MSGIKFRQLLLSTGFELLLSTGFGLPPIISGLEGNLPGPVVAGEEADVGDDNVLRRGLLLFTFLWLLFTIDVDKDVDIREVGVLLDVVILLDVDIVHDVLGGWADLMDEGGVELFACLHLPAGDPLELAGDPLDLAEDPVVGLFGADALGRGP